MANVILYTFRHVDPFVLTYLTLHGLVFKTQLICFRTSFHPSLIMLFISIMLGHLLSFDLNDRIDIIRVHDVKRKANVILYTFRHVDTFVPYLLKIKYEKHFPKM